MTRRADLVQRTRLTLAALLGVAVVAGAAPAVDRSEPAIASAAAAQVAAHEGSEPQAGAEQPARAPSTLGQLVEDRLRRAEQAGQRGEIDRLATLWLTLSRRGQLERVVDNPDGFVAVALRNLDISAHRDAARVAHFVSVDDAAVAALAETYGTPWSAGPWSGNGAADEMIEAEQLLGRLDEPYRTAVELSLQGLNRREVAEQMGVSHAAVRKWMQRLRERWDEWAA